MHQHVIVLTSGGMTGAHLDTLSAVADRFTALRTRPPDLPGAVAAALAEVAGPEPSPDLLPLQAAGTALAAKIDASAAGHKEPPYHNRYHFAETVLAMGWLCSLAREQGLFSASLATLGVIAMTGHDWGHDGSLPDQGKLEGEAAAVVLAVVAPLPDAGCEVVRAVILGTDPAQVAANAARAAGKLPPGPLGPRVDLLCNLANEADVFASFLPALAWQQAEALANEWHGQPPGATVATHAGRLAFLRTYGCFSAPARSMGLADLRDRQVEAFTRAAKRLDAGATPEAGAAALDRMPRAKAQALYAAVLRKKREPETP